MSNRTEGRIVILGALLAVCSSSTFYVAPDYLAALQRAHGFSLAQLGYVSGVESLMIGAACTATGFALPRLGWRAMLGAALACAVGDVLTVFATQYPVILAVRGLTGLLGEGPLYAMSYAVLGSAANPDRAFGVGVGSVGLGAALVIGLETTLSRLCGPAAVLLPYAAAALVLAVVTPMIGPRRSAEATPGAAPGLWLRAGAILASIVLWTAAAGAFWTFTGTAAGALKVSQTTMSSALTIALLVGLGGLILPVLLGNRVSRILLLVAATAGLTLSCVLFFSSHELLLLAVALSVQQISWDFASVYQLAGIATLDRSGRYSAFGAVAQIGGMALGPALSGGALSQFGYGFMPFAVTGIALAGLLLFALAARAKRAPGLRSC